MFGSVCISSPAVDDAPHDGCFPETGNTDNERSGTVAVVETET